MRPPGWVTLWEQLSEDDHLDLAREFLAETEQLLNALHEPRRSEVARHARQGYEGGRGLLPEAWEYLAQGDGRRGSPRIAAGMAVHARCFAYATEHPGSDRFGEEEVRAFARGCLLRAQRELEEAISAKLGDVPF